MSYQQNSYPSNQYHHSSAPADNNNYDPYYSSTQQNVSQQQNQTSSTYNNDPYNYNAQYSMNNGSKPASSSYNNEQYSMNNTSKPASSSYYESNVYPLVTSSLVEDEVGTQRINQSSMVPYQQNATAAPYDPYGFASSQRNSENNQQLVIKQEVDYTGSYDLAIPRQLEVGPITDKTLLPPKVQRFKQKRQIRTAASASAGMLVGAVVLGPLGMVLGGAGGYIVAKKVGKHREKKLLEKCLNDEAASSGSNFKQIDYAVIT